jgi:deoxycytidylate deaminase
MREVKSRDDWGMGWARAEMHRSQRPVSVGAAVVGCINAMDGTGCNHIPRRLSEATDGHSRTVHAEVAAILSAGLAANGATLYVTCPVCHRCAAVAIHAGIRRVVTLPAPDGLADWYEASFAAAREMFAEAGVECVEVSDV